MMDADGAYIHLPVEGGLYDQPSVDMEIYDAVRQKWVELKQERMKKERK